MKLNVTGRIALALLVAMSIAACGQKADTSAADKAKADEQAKTAAATAAAAAAASAAKEKEALEAGVEAVAYGFPLVIMDATRKKISNVATPGAFAAPINQFANVPEFPDASFRDVVRANVDTLYSSAWLDLAKE